MDPTVSTPKIEPGVEMRFTQTQGKMFSGHRAGVKRWTTRRARPEIRDFLQVRRPVLNLSVENGTNLPLLPHVRIEMPEQFLKPCPPAESFEQWLCRVCVIRIFHEKNEMRILGAVTSRLHQDNFARRAEMAAEDFRKLFDVCALNVRVNLTRRHLH
jgi:hypothetical protein